MELVASVARGRPIHEDIPGGPIGLNDLAWHAGVSVTVGAAFELAVTAGVVARSRLPERGP